MLSVRVNSPQKIIWEGKAESVSSKNSQGPFDILPQHANFVTIIQNQDIFIKTAKEQLKYRFNNALIYNHNNLVFIYTL